MSELRVTVVIPVHDRAHLLRRAIDSVRAQGIDDWELLVVDDASVDGPDAVVAGLADGRVRLVRLEENRGAPVARNRGIELARGRFVAFLDSDDEWLPGKLERQLTMLEGDDRPDAVISGFHERSPEGERTFIPPAGVLPYDRLIAGPRSWLTTGTIVVRTELARRVRFDESLAAYQDWDVLVRLARVGVVVADPIPLLIKHHHAAPRIYSGARRHRALVAAAGKYAEEIRRRPDAARRWAYRLALAHLELGELDAARARLAEALALDPDDADLRRLATAARIGVPALRGYLWLRHRFPSLRRSPSR